MRIFSNIKWLLKACIISMVCVVIGACSGTKEVPRKNPNFDYVPNETRAGSTGITFAVVGSQFEVPIGQTVAPMLERFSKNMAEDFAEIVTARGYTLRGPFQTFDEMTFVDKDNSNLILNAKVDFHTDLSGTRKEYNKGMMGLGAGGLKVSGRVIVTCRVSLIISESLTNEKMWTKSVNITPITIELEPSIYRLSAGDVYLSDIFKYDNKFHSEMATYLERQYKEIMNRTYGYLDPREMALINKQAADLRKKKTY